MNKLPPQFIYGIKVLDLQDQMTSPYRHYVYDPKYLPSIADDGTVTPGAWLPRVNRIRLGHRGYHAWPLQSNQLLEIGGSHLFLVKSSGEFLIDHARFTTTSMQFLRLIEPDQDKFQKHIAHLKVRFPKLIYDMQSAYEQPENIQWQWDKMMLVYYRLRQIIHVNPIALANVFAHDFVAPLIAKGDYSE